MWNMMMKKEVEWQSKSKWGWVIVKQDDEAKSKRRWVNVKQDDEAKKVQGFQGDRRRKRNITPLLEWNVHVSILRAKGDAAEMLSFVDAV